MNHAVTASERRHDLDWLRVLAILLLLYFHTGMIFTAEWGWHIKNAETSSLVLEFNYFVSRFRMAVLFLISGAGTAYALGRRGAGQYLRERGRRLLVPLVFGILVIVPPQIYLERVAGGATFASYLQFWVSVLRLEPYPEGNTSWHHLWFVAYLFMYSVAALPLFLWWRSERAARVRAAVERGLAGRGLYLAGAPLAVVMAALAIRYPGPQNVVDDWARLLFYFILFVYGYIVCRAESVWRMIENGRRTSLGLALLSVAAINWMRWTGAEPSWQYDLPSLAWIAVGAFNSWFWVLAILGYGRRYLSFRNRLLDYANEAIYPFYILHQTVIVMLGFLVVQTSDGILMKFLFTSTLSLVATVAVYEYAVRPFALTRFLFGMKPLPRAAAVRVSAAPVPAPPARVAAGAG